MERNYYLYISLFLTTLITVGSLISMKNVVETNINNFDKIIHLGDYLMLALSWFLSFKTKNKSLKKNVLIAVVVFFYGIIIEVLQVTLTNHRQADFYDMLANFVGITAAFVFFTLVLQKKQMN